MSESYQHNGHSVTGGGYHFQFTPKCRQPTFEDKDIQSNIRNSFEKVAKELGTTLNCVEFGPDHTHLFVTEVKNYSIAQLAHRLKGTSSRNVRKELWAKVKKYEWGNAFWTGGYFCEAVGNMTQDVIEYYIKRQQKKHWVKPVMKTRQHTRISQWTLQDFN